MSGMPSRFVEVPSPIEDGFSWARGLGNLLGTLATGLAENSTDGKSITTSVHKALNDALILVGDSKGISTAISVVQEVPPPHGVAACLLTAAFALAIARCFLVSARAGSILKQHRQYRSL